MKLSIIAIGDELLNGQVVDTNTGDIARMIEPDGWTVGSSRIVGDSAASILSAIEQSFSETDVVITTGGLGPTKDDITKAVLCGYFGGELYFDESVFENIREVFRLRGLDMNRLTKEQAYVPTSCQVIQNRVGTAPVMWFEKAGKILVALPGVPFEMREMFASQVFPRLRERFATDTIVRRFTFVVAGLAESVIAERLAQWEESLADWMHLAYLPTPGIVRLRLDVKLPAGSALPAELTDKIAELKNLLSENIIATDDLKPEEILINLLRERGLTLSTAESCTGGNIAHRITKIAGCSDVFKGGVVSYSNEVKSDLLGVDPNVINRFGAVSEQTVRQMAEGVAKVCDTQCAVATSGIAGPSGATDGKPVGTVWIAWHTHEITKTAVYHFPGNRERVIDRASTKALINLILELNNRL